MDGRKHLKKIALLFVIFTALLLTSCVKDSFWSKTDENDIPRIFTTVGKIHEPRKVETTFMPILINDIITLMPYDNITPEKFILVVSNGTEEREVSVRKHIYDRNEIGKEYING